MIRITNKRKPFRRAGVAHPKGTMDYEDKAFTKKQLAMLEVEPNLVVEMIDDAEAGKKSKLVKAAPEAKA